jgi:hypothetical protein
MPQSTIRPVAGSIAAVITVPNDGPGSAASAHPDKPLGRLPAARHLTAPPVMPEMILRWATVNTVISGMLIRMTYVKMRCQLLR